MPGESSTRALEITEITNQMLAELPSDVPPSRSFGKTAKAASGVALVAAIGVAGGSGAAAETVPVQQGDTLEGIVEDHNNRTGDDATVAEAAQKSGIANPDEIKHGIDEIVFDGEGAAKNVNAGSTGNSKWVPNTGDTVSGTLGVSDADFEIKNPGVDADRIFAGRAYNDPRGSDDSAPYTVRKGDTLTSIAARKNTQVVELLLANPEIKSADLIYEGQTIKIKAPTQANKQVKVEPGDTVSELAQIHGTTTGAIAAANNMSDPDVLVADSMLVIPGAGVSADQIAPQAEAAPAPVAAQPKLENLSTDDGLMQVLENKWHNSADPSSPESQHKTAILKAFLDEGVPLPAVAGIMGNFKVESGYDPNVIEVTDRSDKGFGLGQWTFERRDALEARAAELGVSPGDPVFQVKYLIEESKSRTQRDNKRANEWEGLVAITDPAEAARYFRWNFERPNERVAGQDKRATEAIAVYNDVLGATMEVGAKKKAEEAEKHGHEAPVEVGPPVDPNQPQLLNGEVFVPRDPDPVPDGHGEPGTNGNIDDSELVPFGDAWPGHKGQKEMVEAFLALNHEYHKEFGVSLEFTDSYRSYPAQVDTKRRKGKLAATPGTSNHGGGIAIDFASNINHFDSPQYKWMMENAPNFGFVNPPLLRDGKGVDEAWHWEYMNQENPVAESLQEAHKQEVAAGMAYAAEISKNQKKAEAEAKKADEQPAQPEKEVPPTTTQPAPVAEPEEVPENEQQPLTPAVETTVPEAVAEVPESAEQAPLPAQEANEQPHDESNKGQETLDAPAEDEDSTADKAEGSDKVATEGQDDPRSSETGHKYEIERFLEAASE